MAASLEKNLIPKLTSSLPDVEALRFYLTLPECPLMSDSNNFTTIAIPFGTALVNLEKAPLKVLGKNFSIFYSEMFSSQMKMLLSSFVCSFIGFFSPWVFDSNC